PRVCRMTCLTPGWRHHCLDCVSRRGVVDDPGGLRTCRRHGSQCRPTVIDRLPVEIREQCANFALRILVRLLDGEAKSELELSAGLLLPAACEEAFAQEDVGDHPVRFLGDAELIVRHRLVAAIRGIECLGKAEAKQFVLRLPLNKTLEVFQSVHGHEPVATCTRTAVALSGPPRSLTRSMRRLNRSSSASFPPTSCSISASSRTRVMPSLAKRMTSSGASTYSLVST